MRLVRPSEQKAAARKRAAALPPKRPRKAMQREIAREKAVEAEEAKYILLECQHYTTKQDREFWNDGKHPGLWYCQECNFNGIPHWDAWREPYPSPQYPSSSDDAIPPF